MPEQDHRPDRRAGGLLSGPAQTAAAEAEDVSGAQPLPASHYIAGVPFVSWSEAARKDYDNKNILNPSFPAAFDVKLEQAGPTSGMFPEMVSIGAFMEAVAQGCDPRLISDSVFMATRIVVGYDDTRGVLTIHDPIFGPDREVSCDDSMTMWQFDGYDMWTIRLTDAERELRWGLTLEGISPRYAHLLRLEPGSLLGRTRRREEAVEMLAEAIRIYPHYFLAWGEPGNVYKRYGDRQSRDRARKAYKKMEELCSPETEGRVARELGGDFFVVGCTGACLGWVQP